MHIPDGFINGTTSVGAGLVAAGSLAAGLRQAGRRLADRHVPLAGLAAAFIFAAQMINFPVGAGTSGHLIGGGLAAVLLGPWLATVVLSVVLGVQALIFADGGVSALGLNIINMAILAPWSAWLLFRLIRAVLPRTQRVVAISAGIAAGLSVVVASLGFVAEYAIGGTGGAPVKTVLIAMGGVHVLIGIGEGLITAVIVAAVLAARPDIVAGADDLLDTSPRPSRKIGRFVAAGFGVALLVAAFLSPFASSSPDGLERVADDQGFAETAQPGIVEDRSPLAGYEFGGEGGLATAVAGVAGVGITFGVGYLVVRLRRRAKV
ncbi:fused nickel transport protein NikMN [bacterium BMS3Abin02]|nr:fused nickel transport protein NikMN [bacterium BMS3Abin02]GBE20956.1 fused nickel transport protein NikMN [bacterium BMS3Bbin01]HDH24952.1 cobalt ABC transporter permease [Actinomycetota bacterium]HDL48959.1 cobalt ABC transporter permease [Actinomycetota bacterium]